MRADLPLTRDLLLVGGGHAHALVLRRWGMDPLPGARLTVVNPGSTAPYSGMLPGHVAGHYTRDELDIDLVRLCRFAGARLIDGAVTDLDLEARTATVPGRGPLHWDVASLDIGIHSRMPDLPGFAEHAVGAKPLGLFADRWRAHRDAVRAGRAEASVAVIGGGVAGIELAMAMAHALPGAQVTVLERAGDVTGTTAAPRLHAAMNALGVTFRGGVTVARVEAGGVVLQGGETVPAAFVTGAAGARPHAWLAGTGLPLEDGYVRVDPSLAVAGRDDLFAAGDCAHMAHAPRPKAGVFAVRAAPVLHDNLRAALSGGARRRFEPQARYLKLISLGGKVALAERGGRAISHPWLWRWKDRIDRRFMDKLADLPAMATPPAPTVIASGGDDVPKPLCAGCGSKVSGLALAAALADVPRLTRADVRAAPDDDAAIIGAGTARQVLTTDHLRAFTADPVLFARIATVHALGDVWAMGAAPQAAVLTAILPRMSETLQARTLREVTAAVSDVLSAAGATLAGGHSMMAGEMSLGLAVTGVLEGPAIGLAGARPGDALMLTRPLGTGAILAAEMAGAARGADVMEMLATMASPQGAAAAALRRAHAMTDVTGFGLAGHLTNVCRASDVGAQIDLRALPLYAGAAAAIEAGHVSVLHEANRAGAPVDGPDGVAATLLHDPQTAGGLLAALAPDAVDDVLAAVPDAVVIGRIEAAPGLRAI